MDSRWKAVFDVVIGFCVGYSCIVNFFVVSFQPNVSAAMGVVNWIIEVFFIVDMICNFFSSFRDQSTHSIITNRQHIAMHYLKGYFLIDFIAIIPF